MESRSPIHGDARVGLGVAVGVSEDLTSGLVNGFYSRIRGDAELGPIFRSRLGEDWTEHLSKMIDFWSSVLLMTGRFKGSPMAVHAGLNEVAPAHFERWLQLFEQTARELWPPSAAELVIAKSKMIARSLAMGVSVARGELPAGISSASEAAD